MIDLIFLAKLLIVSGYSSEGFAQSEVIDLHDTSVKCQPWYTAFDVDTHTQGAVGGLINDQLIICGGQTPKGVTNICYTMTPTSTYNLFNLTFASMSSASVVLNQDTLLITGGKGNES